MTRNPLDDDERLIYFVLRDTFEFVRFLSFKVEDR